MAKITRVGIALLALVSPVLAQVTTGSITGTIEDEQGRVIPGATVVLVSSTRGTTSAPVVSDSSGAFVFVNVAPDTYTVEVTMPSFATLRRPNVAVSPGDRVSVGALPLRVGGIDAEVTVASDAPLIQAQSGERSFTIPTESVSSLPIASRSFTALAGLSPGVEGVGSPNRIGGGGDTNFVMDGATTMDAGNNAPLLQMNVESIAEVKVVSSGYQAEYGRASGLQVLAVTKSGTNEFHGSVYDVERNSDWNANSRQNTLNGDPKPSTNERDWGYSIGGPVGRPGGDNKLFFFYSHEFQPRTGGGNVVRYRMPTALERQGDFSQTTDNNGNVYPYIKDPNLQGSCNAQSQVACFADGGVLGKIPANRLYAPGLAVFDQWPLPTIADVPAGQSYNYEITRPEEAVLGWQPAIKVDYVPTPSLRLTGKYSGFVQRNQVFNGTLPGFNDATMQDPVIYSTSWSVNYTLNPTTFLEGTFGRGRNSLAGCNLTGGPAFCSNGIPMSEVANRNTAGLADLPLIFPQGYVINPDHYAYWAFEKVNPPIWDGTQILLPPRFQWGSRVGNAPPSNAFETFLNTSPTNDVTISLTKVMGRHTVKAGFFWNHAYKAVNIRGANSVPFGQLNFGNASPGTNPFDTSFGFANAAIGSFNSYIQTDTFVETGTIYNGIEGYVQDNWRVNERLTLDYGLRLVHQQPGRDELGQGSNFLPDLYDRSQAPAIYVAGCANGVYPCSGNNRQAMNPLTGAFLGPGSDVAIGTLVPSSGDLTNGLRRQGQGIVDTLYIWPTLAFAPRFGAAYDLNGDQSLVVRGSAGVFFDRVGVGPTTNNAVANPPAARTVTLRFSQLQNLGGSGLQTEAVPNLLGIWEYDPGKLPTSVQWNAGVQMTLPWASVLDVAYVGQHNYADPQRDRAGVELNSIDYGAAFLPENQDPTLAPSNTPAATSLAATNPNAIRPFAGYEDIPLQIQREWRTYHSLQLSINRRFQNGLSFGVSDTISLYDHRSTPARIEHNADGSWFIRADQSRADELLGTTIGQVHVLRANFVWDLPDMGYTDNAGRNALAAIVNDWQVAGVWAGATGQAYSVGFNYQSGGGNVNLTGSPDHGARVRIVGNPGAGCGGDPYRQFNTSAFQGPLIGSLGLESGAGYLRGCFESALDVSISRSIRLGGGRALQFRVDIFNAPNAAGITGRNTTMALTNPGDPATIRNLPFDENGQLIDARSRPRGAGFGVANGYQSPQTVQAQIRLRF